MESIDQILMHDDIVRVGFLDTKSSLPLVIQSQAPDTRLEAWSRQHREVLNRYLLQYGGILFRGFAVDNVADFHTFMATTTVDLLPYQERSSPRSEVGDRVYTSTDYPQNQRIFLHNENSYRQTWPLKIAFFCATPSQEGGETPIADTRKILCQIHPDISERFLQRGILYVRNYGDGLGLSWQEVFQTQNKEDVEMYCQQADIQIEWKDKGRLRTGQRRPALAQHPLTGEQIWFNHATFFHVSTLAPFIRDFLLSEFQEEDLPNNTYYGDGSPIEPEVLDHLRDVYAKETVKFRWQEKDVLLLDNMLVAHGREAFVGARKILVAMSDPVARHKTLVACQVS